MHQASDELKIESILKQDEEFLEYLHEDKIELKDVTNPEKYPLINKEIPTLCLDRSDGILATCLFWAIHIPSKKSKLYITCLLILKI